VAEKGDRIFPAFILSELPEGLRGFMVAALFAAAMASPVLSALAETTLTMFHDGHRDGRLAPARALWLSRLFVLGWGVALGAFAALLAGRGEQLVPLAFQMTAYTYGPMLGLLLLALFVPRARIHSIPLGVAASMLGVLAVDNAARLGWTDGGPLVAFPWLFPLGGLLCVAVSMLPLTSRR
jgi:SSS family solute:Na+ symporter